MTLAKDAYLESCVRRELQLTHHKLERTERSHRWFIGKDKDFADLKHLRRLREQNRACSAQLRAVRCRDTRSWCTGRRSGTLMDDDVVAAVGEQATHQSSLHQREVRARWLEERRYRALAMVEQRLFAQHHEFHSQNEGQEEMAFSRTALASRGLIIGGSQNGLYERMFRQQPGLFMTKAQFLTCMRTVFGLNIAATDSASDGTWLQAINWLYDSFDVDNRDQMDWRRFIILLNLLVQPTLDCKAQLQWSFAIYSSEGSLDLECSDPVSLGIVKEIMCAPCTIASGLELRAKVDNAWLQLTESDPAANALAREQERRGRIVDHIRLPYKLFRRLLEQPELQPCFEAACTFGIRDPRPWLYEYEARFYHPFLVQCIQSARRRVRGYEQATLFRGQSSTRLLRQSIGVWKTLVKRRDRMRRLIIELTYKWKYAKSAHYLARWKAWTMQEIAAVNVQRTVRGFLGRRRALLMKYLHKYAIRLQSWWRGRRGLLWLRKQQRIRAWAATEIQRLARGMIHRRIATYKLEAHVDSERRKLAQKRQAWLAARQEKAAVIIQRRFRNMLKRRQLIEQWEKENMRQAVEAEIQEFEEQQRYRVMIFKRELQRWFEKRKQEYLANCISERHTQEERKKIIAYRRKQKAEERKAREERLAALAEREYDQQVEEWLQMWERRENERAAARREECRQAFYSPSTAAEQRLKAELKQKLQAQTKVVMKRTALLHVPLENHEAEKVAINEVFDMEEQLERQRVKQEMRIAAEEEIRKKAEQDAAEARRLEARRERQKAHAIVVLQGAFKLWKARRQLRELALARYRKHFDPESISYYYEDIQTGATTWAKPRALGLHDVDAENVWLAMHQDEYTYYYNPFLMDMTWEHPPGTLVCCKCQTEFGTCYVLQEEQAYCPTCFYEHFACHNPGAPFKKINGGIPGVVGMNFHMLADSTWDDVQW